MPKKALSLDDFIFEAAEKIKEGSRAPNIKKYKPHEKQYAFHSNECKRTLYIGGNRSGKTTGGVCEGLWRATCTHPYRPDLNAIGPNRGRVVAVDFVNGIDKIIVPQYKQWAIPSTLRGGSWETAWDNHHKVLHFHNGSFIEFMSYDQNLDKFAGTSRHWIHFDEEPPRTIWVECLARLVDTNGEYWITMTPVEGMTWIYDDLYEDNVGKEIGSGEGQAKVLVIEINTLENPYLTTEGIQGLVDSIDDDDVETRIGGGFVRKGGRVYKNFDPTVGGPHVLSEPIDEPKLMFPERNWLWIMCLDHGLNNPTAVLWLAVDTNGFIVCFDEWYKNELTIDQHATVIKERIRKHGRVPDIMVADPSIKNRNPITKTSVHEEYQRYGLSFILGNNDVSAGIIRVKKYFNKAKYVGQAARRPELFGGPREQDRLDRRVDFSSYEVPAGNDEFARLRFTPNCVNVISEAKKYRWKTYQNKKLDYENNPYDEPHKKDDHAMDALRYGIMTQPDLMADNVHDGSDLDSAMSELEKKLIRAGGVPLHADPTGLDEFAQTTNGNWNPEYNSKPKGSDGGWEIDEHMGGIW